jgi:nitrogenase iron protein NifH
MQKIVLFGKGGSGKSTIATNLSYVYSRKGLRVLHVGCDPKRDSATGLLGERPRKTVMDTLLSGNVQGTLSPDAVLMKSRLGIDCVESGGPEPGLGCAGRGIILMMEQFEKMRLMEGYDVAVYDVLGDLVCGGFAAPLRHGFAEKVFIVVSEEFMSLHAANNISKMVPTYAGNGVALGGLIANMRDGSEQAREVVRRFAEQLNTRIAAFIPRDPLILRAEREIRTVSESAPEAPIAALFRQLAEGILDINAAELPLPTPMDDPQLDSFFKSCPTPA